MIFRACRFCASVTRRGFKLLLLLTAFATGGLIAVEVSRETVAGSGVSATEERDVGSVTEVVLSGVGDLTVVPGEVPGLSITADDNILPLLESQVSGRKLTLRTKSDCNIRTQTKIAYTLTVPKLEMATVSGVGNVRIERFEGEKLIVKVSGAGKATLRDVNYKSLTLSLSGAAGATASGTAANASFRISGAGEIDAVGFKAASAEAEVSGAGTVTVWATDELNARVSGAGSVKYKGSPKLTKKVSGAGSVKLL